MNASPRNVQVRTLELRERTILVVDDEAAGRDLMAGLLTSQGYRVRTATDGMSAIELVEQGGVDLVLLDLMMSKLDGVEVCTHLRRTALGALLPIVFTTSLHDRASRIRAKEAGADDFLVKPIDGLELLVRVERLLRVRAAHELVYAERDRLDRELARARAHSADGPVASPPTYPPPSAFSAHVVPHHSSPVPTARGAVEAEELARQQRCRIVELLRVCESDEARGYLQELLRSAEELEERLSASTQSFPSLHTRSTL